jgi:itaconate CoA-transferase
MASRHPLDGITVVSIEQAVAAPFATRQLADLGARVIKIERPDGGDFARGYDRTVKGLSSYFVWLNRSKQSLAIDLKRPEASDVLARLFERADVFVQNLGPGAAARLGTDAATLRRRFPRLIVCTISGYGSSGPFAEKKAYDLLVQSEVGLVSITGTEETPCKVGISIADIAAGMYAYTGVLTALFTRAASGEGTSVEVSLFDALGEWMGHAACFTEYGGSPPRRTGAEHASIAPYGPFRTSDGRQVFLAIQNEREWGRFCAEVIGRADMARDARFTSNSERVKNRAALHAEIDAVLGRVTFDEAVRRLEAADIACARMNSVAEFVTHPQLSARGSWRTIATPAGDVRALVPPARIEGAEPVMGAVPALGEHGRAILAELGYTASTIDAWTREGVI